MTPEAHAAHLLRAEVLDAYRVMPRFMVFAFVSLYAVFVATYFVWVAFTVYPDLRADKITMEEALAITGVVGAILTALGEMVRRIWQSYTEGGRDWERTPAPEPPEPPKCEQCGRAYA